MKMKFSRALVNRGFDCRIRRGSSQSFDTNGRLLHNMDSVMNKCFEEYSAKLDFHTFAGTVLSGIQFLLDTPERCCLPHFFQNLRVVENPHGHTHGFTNLTNVFIMVASIGSVLHPCIKHPNSKIGP